MGPGSGGHAGAIEDDDFFRALRGDPPGPSPATTSTERPRPSPSAGPPWREAAEPHPLSVAEEEETRHPPADSTQGSRRRRRIIALGSLGLVLMVLVLVVGQGDSGSKQRSSKAGAPAIAGSSSALTLRTPRGQPAASHRRVTWSSTRTAPLAIELRKQSGEPVAAARIDVLAGDRDRTAAGMRVIGELRTDRHGRADTAVALSSGSARKVIRFAYFPGRSRAAQPATVDANLDVVAPLSFAHPPVPARPGKVVRLHGSSVPAARVRLLSQTAQGWMALETVQADRRGRWSVAVRLPRTSGARYAFRAAVVESTAGGYLGTRSDPVKISTRAR